MMHPGDSLELSARDAFAVDTLRHRRRVSSALRRYCRESNMSLYRLARLARLSPALLYALVQCERDLSWKTAHRLKLATVGVLDPVELMQGSRLA